MGAWEHSDNLDEGMILERFCGGMGVVYEMWRGGCVRTDMISVGGSGLFCRTVVADTFVDGGYEACRTHYLIYIQYTRMQVRGEERGRGHNIMNSDEMEIARCADEGRPSDERSEDITYRGHSGGRVRSMSSSSKRQFDIQSVRRSDTWSELSYVL
ncbi:hypothetical protein Tco_1301212 [Tanacetum coccineum]